MHRMHKKLTTYMKLRSGKEVLVNNSIEQKTKVENLSENRRQTGRQQRDRKRRKQRQTGTGYADLHKCGIPQLWNYTNADFHTCDL